MLPIQSSAYQPSDFIPEDRHKPRTRKGTRIFRYIYVVVTLAFGVSLLVLPWSSLWDNNYLLYLYPQFRFVVVNPYFKGFVIGLGLANIIIGLDEIDYFRNISKGRFLR